MRLAGIAIAGALVLAAGCGGSPDLGDPWQQVDGSGQLPDGGTPWQDAATGTDGFVPVLQDRVYAHSAGTLFAIDPNTLVVTVVGDFGWPAGSLGEQMTDIALDAAGHMIGISFNNVYAVDKETAECTFLAALQASVSNGLSWVEGVGVDPGTPALVGVNASGSYYTIDPSTGISTPIGSYGGGFGSSGDLVFVRGAGAFATTSHSSYTSDVLVSVHPATGVVTPIGPTGFQSIWGLAYWGGEVFGFTQSGQFIKIDITTGQGTLLESTSYAFWGAGVTTTAPIVN